jgi:LPXTG-motif cell wall-anchored protein
MRSRIFGALAALILGLVGAVVAAAPAQATPKLPVATVDWSCDGGEVRIDPGTVDTVWRLKAAGEVIWTSDGVVTEPQTVSVPDATVVVELKAGGAWKPFGLPLGWKLPDWCKPLDIAVELPTCECADLVVKVTNPNLKGWIWVRFGDGDPIKVKAGESTTFKSRADVKVWAGWHPEKLKVVKTVQYKAPECATASPSPTVGPQETPTPTTPAASIPPVTPSPLPSLVPAGQIGGQDELPVTGSSVTGVAVAGVGLVAGGIFLLVWLRRRNTGQHAA